MNEPYIYIDAYDLLNSLRLDTKVIFYRSTDGERGDNLFIANNKNDAQMLLAHMEVKESSNSGRGKHVLVVWEPVSKGVVSIGVKFVNEYV